jgi:hypothetical protein
MFPAARVQRTGEVCRSLAQTCFSLLSKLPEPGTLSIVPACLRALQLYSPCSRAYRPLRCCFSSFPSLPYLPLFFPVFINFAIPPPRACYVPQRKTSIYPQHERMQGLATQHTAQEDLGSRPSPSCTKLCHGWAGHVTRIRELRNACTFPSGNMSVSATGRARLRRS